MVHSARISKGYPDLSIICLIVFDDILKMNLWLLNHLRKELKSM